MEKVTASEANRHFSALLRKVTQGASVTILSRGRPAAVISPVMDEGPGKAMKAARTELLKRLTHQAPSGIERNWTRDELYDD